MRLPATPITPTIVFDLDGTLVHTVPDIADALDIALTPYGVEADEHRRSRQHDGRRA